MNNFTNVIDGTSPYERHFGRKGDVGRWLGIAKPIAPGETEVVSEEDARYTPGTHVFYRKHGHKSTDLVPGTVEKVDGESITIKCPNNVLVTRHITDVIIKS